MAILVSLIVIIAIETVFLVILIDLGSIEGQSFPKFSLNPPVSTNCSTLSHQTVSQNLDNRTVRFDSNTSTMNMSAFRVYGPLTIPSSPEGITGSLAEPDNVLSACVEFFMTLMMNRTSACLGVFGE